MLAPRRVVRSRRVVIGGFGKLSHWWEVWVSCIACWFGVNDTQGMIKVSRELEETLNMKRRPE